MLPIQKINIYIFGSIRNKGGEKASLATVRLMDYRCARVAARREMGGNARAPWLVYSAPL